MIEKMKLFLMAFPDWEGDLPVDQVQNVPGSCGLFCAGEEELSRKTDLLGNVTARCRCKFILYRVFADGEDNLAPAKWGLSLQRWLQSRSAWRLAPILGDEPETERIYSEKGHFTAKRQTGTGQYQVTVWAEYTKKYENKGV